MVNLRRTYSDVDLLMQEISQKMPQPDDIADSGAESLAAILAFHSISASAAQITHEFAGQAGMLDANGIIRAARKQGLKSSERRVDFAKLHKSPLPAIAQAVDGRFFIIAKATSEKFLVKHVGRQPSEMTLEEI
jgi:ATP-binding cassette, subfamily B, bacterial HlyB/CyaB